jgi:hypothetical protein
MNPLEIVYYSVALFLALVTLSQWRRRRNRIATRINRGLNSYITTDTSGPCRTCDPASV